jgi:hypothetical protein
MDKVPELKFNRPSSCFSLHPPQCWMSTTCQAGWKEFTCSEIMSHGHRMARLRCSPANLPEDWRLPLPEDNLRQLAVQPGLEQVVYHVMIRQLAVQPGLEKVEYHV